MQEFGVSPLKIIFESMISFYPEDRKNNGGYGGMFEKNMTITLESYIGAVGDDEGVKLEQQYLIEENGLKLMSYNPLETI